MFLSGAMLPFVCESLNSTFDTSFGIYAFLSSTMASAVMFSLGMSAQDKVSKHNSTLSQFEFVKLMRKLQSLPQTEQEEKIVN